MPSTFGEKNRPAPRHLFSSQPHELLKPTIEDAKSLPREYWEYNNSVLVTAAFRGDYGARKERMIREVMAVDAVDYLTAKAKVKEMAVVNRAANTLYRLPYIAGVTLALGGGLMSFPLVFDLDTAMWFNENYVTADVADPEDLETALEVGSWTWNWMEPPLGQISFFLLTVQWARNQMLHVQVKPYTSWMVARRAKSLCSKYPTYNESVTTDFSESDIFENEPP